MLVQHLTSGNWRAHVSANGLGTTFTDSGTKTQYLTAVATSIHGVTRYTLDLTASFTDISLKRVLAADATGFALRNAAKLGGAQSILRQDAGFDANLALTYTIYYIGY